MSWCENWKIFQSLCLSDFYPFMTEYDINCKETLELAGARTAKYFQIVAFLISIIIGKNRDISTQILHKMPNWCLLFPRAVGGGG